MIDFEFWIVLSARRFSYGLVPGETPKAYKKKPTVGPTQIPVKMTITVPESLFTRPELTFKMDVPEPDQQIVIDAETEAEIQNVIQERMGVQVRVVAGDE